MYMRADSPYKTIEDVRTAKEPPKCGATGVTGPDSYLPKPSRIRWARSSTSSPAIRGTDIDLGVERGEIHCRAFTIEALAVSPNHTWRKAGFVRNLFQTGQKRDQRLPDTPTILSSWINTGRKARPAPRRRAGYGRFYGATDVWPSRCSGGSVKDPARGLYEDDERSPVARGSEEEEL